MPRNFKRKPEQQSWNSETMLKAIDAVRKNEVRLVWASKYYKIPKTTLLRRIKDINNEATLNKKVLGSMRPVFSEQHEEELVNYLLDIEKRYYGLSAKDVRSLAFQYAERNNLKHSFNRDVGLAGVDWLSRFRKRHPQFVLRTDQSANSANLKKPNIMKFVNLMQDTIKDCKIRPDRIFTLDETGIAMSRKDFTSDGRIKNHSSQGEKQLLATAVVCMSPTGVFTPPMLIFPRTDMKDSLKIGAPEGTIFAHHPSGMMQPELFKEWFQHFIQYAKPSEQDPVILILDDPVAHTKTISFTQLAKSNNVHILCFPPKYDKNMKPLNSYFLGPLNSCYLQSIEKFLRGNPGKDLTQNEVSAVFGEAFIKAAQPEHAKTCYEKTGLYPYNPDIIDKPDKSQPKNSQVILCTKTFAISKNKDEETNDTPTPSTCSTPQFMSSEDMDL